MAKISETKAAVQLESIILDCLPPNDIWHKKRFSIIRDLPLTNRGDVAEKFLGWLVKTDLGLRHELHENKRGDWDVRVHSKPIRTIEAKCASMDVGGSYQFNGIRYDRQYDLLFALGIAPETLHLGLWRRTELLELKLVPMQKGTNSTFKLTRKPADLYSLSEWHDLWKAVAMRGKRSDRYRERKR